MPQWVAFIENIVRSLSRYATAPAVIIDTIGQYWPVDDENDNAKVTAALMPLRKLTEAGCAVLVFHHLGKDNRNGPRGGSAISGFFDQLVSMTKAFGAPDTDRRRILSVKGRLCETFELTVQLTPDKSEYCVIHGVSPAAKPDLWASLCRLVPNSVPGFTVNDFLAKENWPNQEVPNSQRIYEAIEKNWQGAGWQKGKKGKANSYWLPAPTTPWDDSSGSGSL